MSATPKVAALAVAVLMLAGCTSAQTPDESAWAECVAFYDEHKPDGQMNAEDGETYDSDRTCHNMIGTKGQSFFTEFWNDPERVEAYSRGF